jgi:heat shock protein HtpX
MPAEFYVVDDVNAWVAERGGVLGIGGRRVMGIGLPLLQALSVSEFNLFYESH